MKAPAQGAATSIHLASAPNLAQVTGRFFANSKPRQSSKRGYDEATASQTAGMLCVKECLAKPGVVLFTFTHDLDTIKWKEIRGSTSLCVFVVDERLEVNINGSMTWIKPATGAIYVPAGEAPDRITAAVYNRARLMDPNQTQHVDPDSTRRSAQGRLTLK